MITHPPNVNEQVILHRRKWERDGRFDPTLIHASRRVGLRCQPPLRERVEKIRDGEPRGIIPWKSPIESEMRRGNFSVRLRIAFRSTEPGMNDLREATHAQRQQGFSVSRVSAGFSVNWSYTAKRDILIPTDKPTIFSLRLRISRLVSMSSQLWPTESMEMQPMESVFRALHNVQRFTISNTGFLPTWKTISSSLSSAISEILSLDSLDRLHLIGIGDVPFSFIYHAACSVRVDISVDRNIAAVPTQPSPSQPSSNTSSCFIPEAPSIIHFMVILSKEGNTRWLFLPLEPRYHLEIEYGLIRDIITFPKFGFLHILELGFYISQSRVLPGNLDLIAPKIPGLTPIIKSFTVTLQVMPRIPEIPWELGGPWPVFDVGFMERGDSMTCCLHLKMDYFHGNSSVFCGGFVKRN
ncbi:hypothetical protein B0H13DRAFT_2284749 [Mycena leptocephala]|nr:hypothetical protein B0H13DRAFT_2284749 [Mycena leptocephala]